MLHIQVMNNVDLLLDYVVETSLNIREHVLVVLIIYEIMYARDQSDE